MKPQKEYTARKLNKLVAFGPVVEDNPVDFYELLYAPLSNNRMHPTLYVHVEDVLNVGPLRRLADEWVSVRLSTQNRSSVNG